MYAVQLSSPALQALTRAFFAMRFTKSCFAGTDSRSLRCAVYKVLSGDHVLINEVLTLLHAVDRDLSEYHVKNLTDQGNSFTVSAESETALVM